MILLTKKILMSVLGLNSKDKKSTWDKANIGNPKVNRGCAPLTANRISADCVQILLGPSIPYIPLGVYHTGGFNAMPNSCHLIHPMIVLQFDKPDIHRYTQISRVGRRGPQAPPWWHNFNGTQRSLSLPGLWKHMLPSAKIPPRGSSGPI